MVNNPISTRVMSPPYDIEISRYTPYKLDRFGEWYCYLLTEGYQVTILNSLGVFGTSSVVGPWIPEYYFDNTLFLDGN